MLKVLIYGLPTKFENLCFSSLCDFSTYLGYFQLTLIISYSKKNRKVFKYAQKKRKKK